MPKAQEGMEMQQGASQGGDPMQELAMQVQQMLEQGATPEQVVAQLLQGGVPPEAIAQVMVSVGVPQEQVQQIVEGVMQQMQGQQGDPQGEQIMQDGGEAQQQEQIQQLIMMFSKLQGIDPQQIMEQLSQAQPEQQEEMLQQMAVAVQQAQGQQPQMMHGGVTPSNPGGMILPNDKDFSAIRKTMLKQYKKGGETKDFDSSSTEAFVQNLNGAISNYVSKNMRIGMIERNFKENMEAFNELPKAQDGMETGMLEQYNLTSEQFANLTPEQRNDIYAAWEQDRPTEESTPTVSNNQPNVVNPTGYGYGTMQPAQHYYPGWGPGMPQGSYGQERFLTTPLGQMAGAFGPRYATGNVQMQGIGALQGVDPNMISQQMMNALNNPDKFQFNVEDITRKRLFGKDKVIGKRLTWNPITGQQEVVDQGSVESGQTAGWTMDEQGNLISKAAVKKNVPASMEPTGTIDEKGRLVPEGNRFNLFNPTEEQLIRRGERRAERNKNKVLRKTSRAVNRGEMTLDEQDQFMMHGGVTNSNPGGLIIAENGYDQGEQGVNIKPEWARSFNVGQFTEGATDATRNFVNFLQKARTMGTPEERRAMLSTGNTMPTYEIGSGGRGFYDQEGRFIGTDMGAPTRPGTGTDQDVYGSFTAKNLYGDFLPTGEQFRFGSGGNVPKYEMGDEVEFTEDEIKELEALGYKITRM